MQEMTVQSQEPTKEEGKVWQDDFSQQCLRFAGPLRIQAKFKPHNSPTDLMTPIISTNPQEPNEVASFGSPGN